MSRSFFILSILVMFAAAARSDVFIPADCSILNYRIIPFSVPAIHDATSYTFEIAHGYLETDALFQANRILQTTVKRPKAIIQVPDFGSSYTWRVIYHTAKGNRYGSLHYFETGILSDKQWLLDVTINARDKNDDYVFLDGSRELYDMNGHSVWYLPNIEGISASVRDLKFTKLGTITFISGTTLYEIDWNGNVLWKSPQATTGNEGDQYKFHHDFVRLKNGNYMALGTSAITIPLPGANDPNSGSASPLPVSVPKNLKKFNAGTVEELNKNGKIIWSWNSLDYFLHSDVINCTPDSITGEIDTHENAFYFDEEHSVIYVGFKNIGRILKIKYPEKEILAVYGAKFSREVAPDDYLFNDQHGLLLTKNGDLCVFDNNAIHKGNLPKIIMFKETGGQNSQLVVDWEFQCTVEDDKHKSFGQGGNVVELNDGSLLVCMGSNYGKTFIIDKQGKVLWSALPKWSDGIENGAPHCVPQYRANIIQGKKQLEQLIWSAQNSVNNKLPM